ncbi:DUF4240 domain-containing protein [Cellulomonas cellasea]|uniref:DUF4240 domain-containing protein n=2 Tax=Cellulomonas cellasea TaxID=43670 RepID=A0A0A0BEF8_9CELL|nr:DUF4240 domain-containing protein [Cellulomonas cellasea]KGM03736.1 hypothetical protein Q760_13550 [Cellulomonas cellasea DSM 20118]GEA86899.1 hypothetical protein CCE01nite_08480 [Cellulomonas cellasea]
MDTEAYWQLVDEARTRTRKGPDAAPDADDVADSLRAVLVERGVEAARAADAAYDELVATVHGPRLWGAAYLIGGGCSDDGFDYFLGWLVAQGREVFERAAQDPDSLADVVDEDTEAECEDMLAAAWDAYEELTGEEFPEDEEADEDGDDDADDEPAAEPFWDFDDEAEMRIRYPRLAAMFLED